MPEVRSLPQGAGGGLGSRGGRGRAGPRRGGGSVTVNLRAAPPLSLQITCSRRLCRCCSRRMQLFEQWIWCFLSSLL
ncbi:unnamed protein product [Urochloa humidicola]